MKSTKSKKVYVAGTRDRLFVVRNIYDNGWALVDKRGNYYANEKEPKQIIKHIDASIKKGIYETR